MSFTSIPILDLSLARNPETKPDFLKELRHALMEVGFLYLKNVGISDELFQRVVRLGKAFLIFPRKKTPASGPGLPVHHNLLAPNQWPSEAAIPGFRESFTDYMDRMGKISIEFTSLIAEAIELPAGAFDKYFDADQQHKLKIVKYPDLKDLGLEGEGQGVGPHKDSMLSSYLLQATQHRGLQVQNVEGRWIDCPPIDGTLVVAIGQGLRRSRAAASASARFRIMCVGSELLSLRSRGSVRRCGVHVPVGRGGQDAGEATLRNRVKSHPDVAERWYPDLLQDVMAEQARIKSARKEVHKAVAAPAPAAVVTH
ncbi:unnamed protein product [Parascedosporium putredinis]|uniref:Fe2OG dioxygenase domain-containing protein n=1 Tax=Parascedosporium putredinis TaxID=1442378 RepID=A0A9P1ME61_9PEZI|nr:unnamed protein product [Parascedosporium putredinis]CAI8002025.1 unnamed protein product [Parascedosporium putredinis]